MKVFFHAPSLYVPSGANFQQLHITVVSNPWLVVLFLVLELKTDATGRVSQKQTPKVTKTYWSSCTEKAEVNSIEDGHDRVS